MFRGEPVSGSNQKTPALPGFNVRSRADLSGDLYYIGCLQALRSFDDVEFNPVSLIQAAETLSLNSSVVHEHVRAVIAFDEPITLFRVEPFDSTLHFGTFLLTPHDESRPRRLMELDARSRTITLTHVRVN